MRALIAIVLTCCISLAGAMSNNPVPSDSQKAAPPQQKTGDKGEPARADQRGAEDRLMPAAQREDGPQAKREAAEAQNEHGDKAPFKWGMTAEDATAVFTGLLVVVGAGTAWILICQVRAMRQEFIASHRPRIVMRRVMAQGLGGNISGVRYLLANIGDSEANIVEINARLWPKAGDTSKLPVPPPYVDGAERLNIRIVTGESVALVHYADATDLEAFKCGGLKTLELHEGILFFGYIDYLDKLGGRKRTAFLRSYNPATKGFDAVERPDYEYQD